MLRRIVQLAVFSGLLVGLSGCITVVRGGSDLAQKEIPRVSVQYDPYDFKMYELQDAADTQCQAKGYPYGVRVDNSVNTQAVRWSHMYFDCVAAAQEKR